MATEIAEAESNVCKLFKIDSFKDYQRNAVKSLLEGKDCFVSQPTGSGKSLIFQALPFFNANVVKTKTNNNKIISHGLKESIYMDCNQCILVVSPLISLMKDQVASLAKKGIHAIYLNDEEQDKIDFEVCIHTVYL